MNQQIFNNGLPVTKYRLETALMPCRLLNKKMDLIWLVFLISDLGLLTV